MNLVKQTNHSMVVLGQKDGHTIYSIKLNNGGAVLDNTSLCAMSSIRHKGRLSFNVPVLPCENFVKISYKYIIDLQKKIVL